MCIHWFKIGMKFIVKTNKIKSVLTMRYLNQCQLWQRESSTLRPICWYFIPIQNSCFCDDTTVPHLFLCDNDRGGFRGGAPGACPYIFCKDRTLTLCGRPRQKEYTKLCELTLKITNFLLL